MALMAFPPLVAVPDMVSLPAKINFAVDVFDPDAVSPPRLQPVTLRLTEDNQLTFADGRKTITQQLPIGRQAVTVNFPETRIVGSRGDVVAFRVSVRGEADKELASRLIILVV